MITLALAVLGKTRVFKDILDNLAKQTMAPQMNVYILDGNDDRGEVEGIVNGVGAFHSVRTWHEKESLPEEKWGRWPSLYNFLIHRSQDPFVTYWSDVFPDTPYAFERAIGIASARSQVGAVVFSWRDGLGSNHCVYRSDYGNHPLINFGVIRREAFISVGGLDEEYYFYHADQDFTNALAHKGWDIHSDLDDSQLKVTHFSGEKSANRYREAFWQGKDLNHFRSKWSR
jgi:hypothetical protein